MLGRALAPADRCLQRLGIRLLPAWRVQWWTAAEVFQVRGRQYECFYHRYNCGWPPYVSERTVELAIANAWLEEFRPNDVIEIGAVTPYYGPHRVANVVDPFDNHPLVTDRKHLHEVSLDRPTLSISTFEHIGMSDYGSKQDAGAVNEAFEKLIDECERFLVSVPVGYNPLVDELLFEGRIPDDVSLDFVVRDGQSGWRTPVDRDDARRPYGDPVLQRRFPGTVIGTWANSVAFLERGGANRV